MTNIPVRKLLATALLCVACSASQAQVTDLMRVYELAIANDPSFRSAGATNRAAQESPNIARAGLLPSVSASVSATGNQVKVREADVGNVFAGGQGTRKFNEHDYSVNLTQPLYRKDRWVALDQAKLEVDQADATFAFEGQALMLRASQRYFDVLRAADTLGFARSEQEAFGQQLEQSQQRFDVGLIAITGAPPAIGWRAPTAC